MIPTSRISPVSAEAVGASAKGARAVSAQRQQRRRRATTILRQPDFAFNRITTDQKIDWNVTDKFNMFGHLGYLNYNDLDPQMFGEVGGPPISDYGGNEGQGTGHTLTFSITGNYVASPRFVLDGNFGITRMVTELAAARSRQETRDSTS